ncbi:MAG: 2OG-Fe(II) oxygenase [Sphingomonas sp.]|jgi:prolyl 4-hydroxylase
MTHKKSSTDIAQDFLDTGRVNEAINVIESAVRLRDADAIFLLAIWHLIGFPVQRDLVYARRLLKQAAESGQSSAALMEVALTANGSGGKENWPLAMDLLKKAAEDNLAARYQLNLICTREKISSDSIYEFLDKERRIIRYSKFIDHEECNYLIKSSDGLLMPAVVNDPNTGSLILHPVRTGEGAVIGPTREDLVIQLINKRLAEVTATSKNFGEPLSILKYSPLQEYKLHSDAIKSKNGNRIKTAIIYLNDNFIGGATNFPKLGISVKPSRGDMITFDNFMPNGMPDPMMVHAGLPVIKGVKWLATRWIRDRPYDPWNSS